MTHMWIRRCIFRQRGHPVEQDEMPQAAQPFNLPAGFARRKPPLSGDENAWAGLFLGQVA